MTTGTLIFSAIIGLIAVGAVVAVVARRRAEARRHELLLRYRHEELGRASSERNFDDMVAARNEAIMTHARELGIPAPTLADLQRSIDSANARHQRLISSDEDPE